MELEEGSLKKAVESFDLSLRWVCCVVELVEVWFDVS